MSMLGKQIANVDEKGIHDNGLLEGAFMWIGLPKAAMDAFNSWETRNSGCLLLSPSSLPATWERMKMC